MPTRVLVATISRSGFPYGGGDGVTNVVVLDQLFDFATFDALESHANAWRNGQSLPLATRLQTMANSRRALGMFSSRFIEMLARQITEDLQSIRDRTLPGRSQPLVSKDAVMTGTIARLPDGTWNASAKSGDSGIAGAEPRRHAVASRSSQV